MNTIPSFLHSALVPNSFATWKITDSYRLPENWLRNCFENWKPKEFTQNKNYLWFDCISNFDLSIFTNTLHGFIFSWIVSWILCVYFGVQRAKLIKCLCEKIKRKSISTMALCVGHTQHVNRTTQTIINRDRNGRERKNLSSSSVMMMAITKAMAMPIYSYTTAVAVAVVV